jgi:hypothetical protein
MSWAIEKHWSEPVDDVDLPAAHLVQVTAPPVEYEPATQLTQLVDPVACWDVPAAHLMQRTWPELPA